ncbi:MAG: hypothetical protein H6555_07175 [Lewinellaceae bacterium]|nr:hypothetical protein [Lewinellaceae bacterium]
MKKLPLFLLANLLLPGITLFAQIPGGASAPQRSDLSSSITDNLPAWFTPTNAAIFIGLLTLIAWAGYTVCVLQMAKSAETSRPQRHSAARPQPHREPRYIQLRPRSLPLAMAVGEDLTPQRKSNKDAGGPASNPTISRG